MRAIVYMLTGGIFCLTVGMPWLYLPHWYQACGFNLVCMFLAIFAFLSGGAANSRHY